MITLKGNFLRLKNLEINIQKIFWLKIKFFITFFYKRAEFKYLLCYLRQFFELFEMFEKIDVQDDNRLDL